MANHCKYYKQQRQVSYDGGITWQNLNQFQKGALYEEDSADCGYQRIERWTTTGTTCIGYDKYNVQVKEVSDDGGITWTATTDTQNTLNERNSTDCGYDPTSVEYRWVDIQTWCEPPTLWARQKKQVSYNGGQTWQDVVPEEMQVVVKEYASSICGGSGEYKLTTIGKRNQPIVIFCAHAANPGRITSGDVLGNETLISNVTEVNIGSCATELWTNAFNGAGITDIVVPSGVTELHNSVFSYCSKLKTIEFQRTTPPAFGTNTFFYCFALEQIIVPQGSLNAYKSVGTLSNWTNLMVEKS